MTGVLMMVLPKNILYGSYYRPCSFRHESMVLNKVFKVLAQCGETRMIVQNRVEDLRPTSYIGSLLRETCTRTRESSEKGITSLTRKTLAISSKLLRPSFMYKLSHNLTDFSLAAYPKQLQAQMFNLQFQGLRQMFFFSIFFLTNNQRMLLPVNETSVDSFKSK